MGLGQTCRIVDALKTGAVLEQIIAEIGDAVGQLYFGQAGTFEEGLIIRLVTVFGRSMKVRPVQP